MSMTYVAGSNMLESMKHCVAMGGADVVSDGAPLEFMFNAFAATLGISKPVPERQQ